MLDKKKIGNTIAQYRKEIGMTQKELADVLHISYQAVSKWESGVSLPTVEMLCEIAGALGVSTDAILMREKWMNGTDMYEKAGVNTVRLHMLKEQLEILASEDEKLLNSHYLEPVIYQTDVSDMKEPVHALIVMTPGSKAKLARERGFDREICADVAANGMNLILTYGMKPVVLKGMIVCGNNNNEQLRNMTEALKKTCEENGVMFAGVEIGAQPMHYKPDEYQLQVGIAGVGDRSRLVTGEAMREGDVLIGLMTEGINSINYPILKMLIDKKPELVHAKIDGEHYFSDELLKPNVAFCHEIARLLKEDIPHGIFRNGNAVDKRIERRIPQGLGIRIDLAKLPVLPLYRFLLKKGFVEENIMPYCFQMGVGMTIAVPEEKAGKAMEIIRRYHDCHVIGSVEKNGKQGQTHGKVWAEGTLKW